MINPSFRRRPVVFCFDEVIWMQYFLKDGDVRAFGLFGVGVTKIIRLNRDSLTPIGLQETWARKTASPIFIVVRTLLKRFNGLTDEKQTYANVSLNVYQTYNYETNIAQNYDREPFLRSEVEVLEPDFDTDMVMHQVSSEISYDQSTLLTVEQCNGLIEVANRFIIHRDSRI